MRLLVLGGLDGTHLLLVRLAGNRLAGAGIVGTRPAQIGPAEAEHVLVEGVHAILPARVHLGPAEGSRLVLFLEPAADTRLPEPEDRAPGVDGLREHSGAARPYGFGDHLAARPADPVDGRRDVVGGEVDAPGGRHPAVPLGGERGDEPAVAEGIGVRSVGVRAVRVRVLARPERPPEEFTVEALARFEVRELHIHPARRGRRECGHGPGSFRSSDARHTQSSREPGVSRNDSLDRMRYRTYFR